MSVSAHDSARIGPSDPDNASERTRSYWEEHIHDLAVAKHPVGSQGFFTDLEEYRYDKLRYLDALIRAAAPAGKKVLEIGCGAGVDLARFAALGATVTGIDFSRKAIDLARANFRHRQITGTLQVMDACRMEYPSDTFDLAYAHGVLQYAADPEAMIGELHRVLKPGGMAILQVYNRRSWLPIVSRLTGVPLEHQDAPVYRLYSAAEFRRLLGPFRRIDLLYERFPVKTRLHSGAKAFLYNQVFVGSFGLLPQAFVRPLGWHLIARAWK